ncbi:hypothetical protein EDD86DRAFT_117506 [Gorgonomyces haynaldii]|nr:hypothetical protein EDD86DRAFT_117506 [Gorgonomyces haynaldii]
MIGALKDLHQNIKTKVGELKNNIKNELEGVEDKFRTVFHLGQPATPNEAPVMPFDLVLFKGDDPVGKMIQKIENDHVHESVRKKDGPLWTHVGVVVSKDVLPLDCLEPGKLYIYESILSGTVLGVYTYSEVPAADHPVSNIKKEFYAGPQLREFEATVKESKGDIGIARLTREHRRMIQKKGIQSINEIMLQIHDKYKTYGYPFELFPELASASDALYDFKEFGKKVVKSIEESIDNFKKHVGVEDEKKPRKKAVFCSQFAAIIYAALGLPGFEHTSAGKFTPIELDAMECFEDENYFVKVGDVLVMKDGLTAVKKPSQ